MNTNEIQRQARNAVRKGSILEVDHKAGLCRVAIGENDEDGLQTNWLPWLTPAAGGTREWLAPTNGEQVIVLGPMGDLAQGVVLRGFFSDAFPAPDQSPDAHVRLYPDGARIAYNFADHALTAELPAGATVHVVAPGAVTVETKDATVKADDVTLDAKQTTCTGGLRVKGPLVFESGMSGKGGTGEDGSGPVMALDGSAHFTKTVTADGDVQAQGVSLVNHPHQAQGADARTSKPIPGGA